MLAKLGNLESADATAKLTAVMNGYNLTLEETAKAVDAIISLDNSMATSTANITEAMAESSSVAKEAGVSYQDLAAYVATIASVTQQSGDTVGNAMKSMLSRMIQVKAGVKFDEEGADISNVEKVLTSYGIKLRDTTNSFRDMSDVLADVAAKYKELGEAGDNVAQAQITTALGNQRQANYINALLQNWDMVIAAQNEAGNSAGTAAERYAIYMDSIEAKTNQFKTAWQDMWSDAISSKTIKSIVSIGSAVLKLIDNLGGLVPVLLAVAAALAVIKWQSTLGALNSVFSFVKMLIPAIEALAGRILFATGIIDAFAASEAAMAASTALATGGMSLAIAAVVLVIVNLAKKASEAKTAMQDLNAEFDEASQTAKGNEDELNSLAEEYEELANKTEKSTDDIARLLDIQTTLNTKYGALTDGINVYTDAIDGNSEAIEENIKWMKAKSLQEAQSFIDENKSAYEKAKGYLETPGKTGFMHGNLPIEYSGTPEERVAAIRADLAAGEYEYDERGQEYAEEAIDSLNKEIDAAKELIIDYEHYTNVVEANSEAVKAGADAQGLSAEALDALTKKASDAASSISSAMNAVEGIVQAFQKNGEISAQQVETLRQMFPTEFTQALIIEGNQIKLNIPKLKELTIAYAEEALAAAKAAAEAGNHTAELDAAVDAAQIYVNLVKSDAYWNDMLADSANNAAGGTSNLTSKQQAYNDLLKDTIAMLKQEAETQKENLQNQIDKYKKLIDKRKELLEQQKKEDEYNDKVADKNKEISNIDNELLQIQFDTSEEANAKRLELESERADKVKELDDIQNDYSIQSQEDALDKSYEDYKDALDKKIAALDRYLENTGAITQEAMALIAAGSEQFYDQLAKWNSKYGDGIEATIRKLWDEYYALQAVAGVTGGGTVSGTGARTLGVGSGGAKAASGSGKSMAYSKGGAGIVPDGYPNDSATLNVESGEAFIILNKQQQNQLSMSNLTSLLKTPNFSTNTGGNSSFSVGDIVVQVSGSLDKTVLPDLKNAVFEVLNQSMNVRGIKRNATSYSV